MQDLLTDVLVHTHDLAEHDLVRIVQFVLREISQGSKHETGHSQEHSQESKKVDATDSDLESLLYVCVLPCVVAYFCLC